MKVVNYSPDNKMNFNFKTLFSGLFTRTNYRNESPSHTYACQITNHIKRIHFLQYNTAAEE
jgi:hypothetical protein